jgi:hypothetical protein
VSPVLLLVAEQTCADGISVRWFNRVWIVKEAVFALQILFLHGHYIIQPETLFNVGKLLMLSGWASKMIDRVSLYGDVEVPPPGAVATLALMREHTSTLQTVNNLGALYTEQMYQRALHRAPIGNEIHIIHEIHGI